MPIYRPVGGAGVFLRARALPSGGPAYAGPGDIVSGATAWYGLRAYSAAVAATGTQKAVNVRRASDNATQDILILTGGALDIASANTFATVDATGTGSISGTTLTFTGGHVGDTVTGGTTAPGTYIVSGSSPTWTVFPSQTVASAALTLQFGLYVTTWYDQSGNSKNAVQATAGSQPQLIPGVKNGLPCAYMFSGATTRLLTATLGGTVAQPYSISVVSERAALISANDGLFQDGSNAVNYGGANALLVFAGGSVVGPAASDGAFHALNIVLNGASSVASVDGGTAAIATVGTSAWGATIILGEPSHPLNGYIGEAGLWPSGFTPTQYGNMHTNQSAYWGTP